MVPMILGSNYHQSNNNRVPSTVDPEINLPLNDAFSQDDWQRLKKINEKRTSTCQEHPTDRETQTMTSEARHYWVGPSTRGAGILQSGSATLDLLG